MARGRGWDPAIRQQALDMLAAGASLAETRRTIEADHGKAPAASTLKRWAAEAGVERAVQPQKGGDPEAALAARLARLQTDREALSEVILDRLTRPAAELIARRLEEEVNVVVPRVDAARQRLDEAVDLFKGFLDADPADAFRKGALEQVRQARLVYEAELGRTLPIRDLVGVLTRSIADHLALEGVAAAEELEPSGAITVELVMPRGDPAKASKDAVDQADLSETPA